MQYDQNYYIAHHGIKGQKWGIRRFQNKDGSLTSLGRRRQEADNDQKPKKKGLTKAQKIALGVGIGAGAGLAAYGVSAAVRGRKNAMQGVTDKAKELTDKHSLDSFNNGMGFWSDKEKKDEVNALVRDVRKHVRTGVATGAQIKQDYLQARYKIASANNKLAQTKGNKCLERAWLGTPLPIPHFRYDSKGSDMYRAKGEDYVRKLYRKIADDAFFYEEIFGDDI